MIESGEARGDQRKATKLLGPEYVAGNDPTIPQHFLAFTHLFNASLIEIREQDPEVYEQRLSKAQGWVGKSLAALECAADFAMIEKATRLVNVLRRDENPVNELYNRAMDDPKIQDHAWKHIRMFEKGMRHLLMRSSRLIKGGLGSFFFVEEAKNSNRYRSMLAAMPYVLMRGAGTHDRHQTFTQHIIERNKALGNSEFNHVKPKDNHEIYGALMVLLDERNLMRLRRFSEKRARLADAMLVVGILGHGEPTTYFRELHNFEKAYVDLGHGRTQEIADELLFKLVDSHSLDWTSISPSQLLKIGQYLASDGKLSVFPTETGLPLEVEELYRKSGDIDRVKNDHRPLFYNINPPERQLLMRVRQLFAVIDLSEMLLPPHAAGDRKLMTPKAFNRVVTAALNPKRDGYDAETYIRQLFEIDGHTCSSDLERQLFEAFQYLETVKASGLLDDPEIGEDFTNLLIDAFCGTFWYFSNFIEKNREDVTRYVNTSFRLQKIDAAIKMYRKYGVQDESHNVEDLQGMGEVLEQKPLGELLEYLDGYMTMPQKRKDKLKEKLIEIDERRIKMLHTVNHKIVLENANPMNLMQYDQLFMAAADRFASELHCDVGLLHERYEIWQSRSLRENIQASRVPWASSEQSVGSFDEVKTY